MLSPTTFLTVAIQCAASIHPSTAFDVARTESGFNPYAIAEMVPGSNRVISHMPVTRAEATRIAARLAAKGRRYSVGLMQITSSNFRHYGVTASDLFTPCINLSVFERILTDCYVRGGSLKRALSCYYSGNFETGQRSETSFGNTSYIQRIGYVVPSTRQDRQTSDIPEENQTTTVIYPDKIIRGNLPVNENATVNHSYYAPQIVRGRLLTAQQKE